jgi:hypothetical protein
MNEVKDLDIRQFKLSNSENVIGLVVDRSSKNYVIVERPVIAYCYKDGSYKLEPWFELSDHKVFKINKNHIVSSIEIDNIVKATYIQYVTSVFDQIDIESDIESEPQLVNTDKQLH